MASPASCAAEHLLLTENFPLLLANRARILAHPQLGLAWSPSMYLSLAYISGGGMLPLRLLLTAWEQDLMTGKCPHCDGDQPSKSLHLFCVGGSVLSGANRGWGVCACCHQAADFTFTSGSDGELFSQWVGRTVALKKSLGIPDEFAVQWQGIAAVEEARGGMTIDGERVFVGENEPGAGTKRRPELASVPPTMARLVATLRSQPDGFSR